MHLYNAKGTIEKYDSVKKILLIIINVWSIMIKERIIY